MHHLRISSRLLIAFTCLCLTIWHLTVSKEMDECKLDLMEESPPETIVGNLVKDCGLSAVYNQNVLNTFRYSFLHADSVAVKFFDLDEKSGELRRSKLRLDRDHPDICRKKDSCQLNLDVAIKPVQRAERVKVRAELLDMNDNSPSFRENEIFLSINEASPVGSSYLLPAASDDDSPTFGIQRYEIESPSEKLSMVFSMSVSGNLEARLVLKTPLDRESESHYTLTLKAIDGGRGGLGGFSSLTGTMTISVLVADFNDNKPIFTSPSYEITLKEDMPLGSTVIRVSATDADENENAEIEYAFTTDTMKMCGSLFQLNNRSGDVLLIESLDREKTSVHQLRVTAKDRGLESLSSEAVVIVRVDDVNDNHPIITVTFLDEGRNGNSKPMNAPQQSKFVSTEISEDAEPGSFVGHVSVRDVDEGEGGKVECRKNGSLKFTLQKSFFLGEYRIVLSSGLDRENSPFYFITLLCFDYGENPKTSEMLVKIVVKDVNDNAPEFEQSSYRASLAENNFIGEVVLQVTAKDNDEGDNSKIDYSLEGHVERYFQIDQRGLISALVRIDRELNDNFKFHVLAKDRGSPRRSSSAQVIITIDDLNDERPIFTKSLYTFSVLENEPLGTAIGKIEAKDKDLTPFNEFLYHISAEHSSGVSRLFHVHPKTGVITTKGAFDRELQHFYKFHVAAVDSHVELMSGTALVLCSVLDQNDNFPDIRFPSANNDTVYISSRLPVGSVIAKVDASDNDTDLNGKLTYRIVGDEKNFFQVDKDSGFVKTVIDLTKHDFQVVKLNVEVSDHGDPPNSRFAQLRIHINSSINSGHQRLSKSEFLSSISGAYTLVLVIAVTSIVFIFVIAMLVCAVLLRQHRQKRSSKHKSGLSFISCDEAYELAQSTPSKDHPHSSPKAKTCLPLSGDQSGQDDHEAFFNGIGSRGCTSTKFGKKYRPLTVLHESSNIAEICLHNGGLGGKQQSLRYQLQSKRRDPSQQMGRSSPPNNSPLPPPPPPRALHRFLSQRPQARTTTTATCCNNSLNTTNTSSQHRKLNDNNSSDNNPPTTKSDNSPAKRLARTSPQGSLESSLLSSETSSRQGRQTAEKKVAFNLDSPVAGVAANNFQQLEDVSTTKQQPANQIDGLKIKEVSV